MYRIRDIVFTFSAGPGHFRIVVGETPQHLTGPPNAVRGLSARSVIGYRNRGRPAAGACAKLGRLLLEW